MKKRTVTTIEIAERLIISAARTDTPRPSCPACAGRAMLTPEEAAALARVAVRSLSARIETEGIHILETPDGLLLLCADSLTEWARSDAPQKIINATNLSSANRREVEGDSHGELDQ